MGPYLSGMRLGPTPSFWANTVHASKTIIKYSSSLGMLQP